MSLNNQFFLPITKGLTAGWFGLVRAVLFGGAATLAVTGIWAVLFPVLSRMDRFPHHDKEEADKLATEEPA